MLAFAVARIAELGPEALDPGALSAAEQQRLASFVSEARRRQFLAVRALARQLCTRVNGPDADGWALGTHADGGPCIVDAPALTLSLTHSGDWVGCALADHPVGIDLQVERRAGRAYDLAGIAALVLSAHEQRLVDALPEAERAAAFLARWTLVEAWGKQQRSGLDLQRSRELRFDAAATGHAWTWSRQTDDGLVALALCVAQAQRTAPSSEAGWGNAQAWRIVTG